MILEYADLEALRTRHPAWRLLRSDNAPLVASFLHRVFVAPNVRVMPAAGLIEALEDELFAVRERLGSDAFPKPALTVAATAAIGCRCMKGADFTPTPQTDPRSGR